jgi:NAD(P)-dependent dehydrogenase (short-subunit alcohol dehydrogenase family)
MFPKHNTALIVGASRGLGLGLAQELFARGWQVTATARNPATANGLNALVQDSAGKVTVATADITQRSSIDALASIFRPGQLDLVFINAGIAGPSHQSVETVSDEDFTALLLTNSLAPLRVARRLLPCLNERGTLAFMSSALGSVADNKSGGFDLYRASKAALNILTRSLAATTLKGQPLRVLTLHPGWVRTDLGGPHAPLSIEESVRGLANVLEAPGDTQHRFLDYQGNELPW